MSEVDFRWINVVLKWILKSGSIHKASQNRTACLISDYRYTVYKPLTLYGEKHWPNNNTPQWRNFLNAKQPLKPHSNNLRKSVVLEIHIIDLITMIWVVMLLKNRVLLDGGRVHLLYSTPFQFNLLCKPIKACQPSKNGLSVALHSFMTAGHTISSLFVQFIDLLNKYYPIHSTLEVYLTIKA